MIYASLRAPADYVGGGGGGSFLKSCAAVNYFPCDSLRSLSRRKRVSESVYIKSCVACTAGVHGAGQRP